MCKSEKDSNSVILLTDCNHRSQSETRAAFVAYVTAIADAAARRIIQEKTKTADANTDALVRKLLDTIVSQGEEIGRLKFKIQQLEK